MIPEAKGMSEVMSEPPLFDFPIHNTILRFGGDAEERLEELGIPLSVLHEALTAGDVAARQATEDSPKTAAGLQRWMSTVQNLRRGLRAEGWTLSDPANSPQIVSPSGIVSLAVVTGDLETGSTEPGSEPRNLRPFGPTLASAIEKNRAKQVRGQLEITDVVEAALARTISTYDGTPIQWVLMHHRSSDGKLRAEVSLPTSGEGRFIRRWRERIVLPPLDFEGPTIPADSDLTSDDVDFDILEA